MINKYMQIAIEEAKKSGDDIPVGAIIVKNGEIIAKAHNTREVDQDITSHAEIVAIRKAEQLIKNWRLDGCELYVTLEPCPMCGWAILQSRIDKLYFGSYDVNYGSFSSKLKLQEVSNSKISIYGGIMEDECDNILNDFFCKVRKSLD